MAEASIALNRFGLGGRPGDDPGAVPKRWLLAQLDRYDPRPQPIAALPGSPTIAADLRAYQQEAQAQRRMRKAGQPEPAPETGMRNDAMSAAGTAQAQGDPLRDGRRLARRQLRDHYAAAVTGRALAAVQSQAPFVERLVHFWANHFAVSADKVATIGLAGTLEFEAVRPHVFGTFRDMLHAVERHPAMLLYLDQAQSVGPGSPAGQRAAARPRKLGLNENLAREILELHTLGVRTGYTQADVTELARAMTGWTVSGLAQGVAGPMAKSGASASRRGCTSRARGPSWAGAGLKRARRRPPACSTCSPPTPPRRGMSQPSSPVTLAETSRRPRWSRGWRLPS